MKRKVFVKYVVVISSVKMSIYLSYKCGMILEIIEKNLKEYF